MEKNTNPQLFMAAFNCPVWPKASKFKDTTDGCDWQVGDGAHMVLRDVYEVKSVVI